MSGVQASARPRPRRQKRPDGPLGDAIAFGERPQAPWHPLPLAEILIFVGMIAMVIGATRGKSGLPAIAAGVLAVVLGTYEFSWREHMAGYRSHAILLTGVPVALLFGVLAYVIYLLGAPTVLSIVVPLFVAIAIVVPVYRWLRSAFRDARGRRIAAAGL